MNKQDIGMEQVALLGLLPLLGGTQNIQTAAVIMVGCILISFIIRAIFVVVPAKGYPIASWTLAIGIGGSLSYLLYLNLPLLPWLSLQHVGIYVLLLGLTPICYIGCAQGISWKQYFMIMVYFLVLMIWLAVIRELLGMGSFFGMTFVEPGFAPLGIINTAPGAFITLGSILLIIRAINFRFAQKA